MWAALYVLETRTQGDVPITKRTLLFEKPARIEDNSQTPRFHRLVSNAVFRSAGRPQVINRAVYATITVTSVLIVYDGWSSLKLLDVVGVIAGPILAMFIAHIWAEIHRQAPMGNSRPTPP